MNDYLLCRCADYRLLLDARQVDEVEEVRQTTTSGHRQWRGEKLPVIDLSEVLGVQPEILRHQIVCRETPEGNAQRFILEVDQAMDLCHHKAGDFMRFPPVSPFVAECFDGAVPDPETGTCIYRLRLPPPLKGSEVALP